MGKVEEGYCPTRLPLFSTTTTCSTITLSTPTVTSMSSRRNTSLEQEEGEVCEAAVKEEGKEENEAEAE